MTEVRDYLAEEAEKKGVPKYRKKQLLSCFSCRHYYEVQTVENAHCKRYGIFTYFTHICDSHEHPPLFDRKVSKDD